jgi:WD40 repeat protein
VPRELSPIPDDALHHEFATMLRQWAAGAGLKRGMGKELSKRLELLGQSWRPETVRRWLNGQSIPTNEAVEGLSQALSQGTRTSAVDVLKSLQATMFHSPGRTPQRPPIHLRPARTLTGHSGWVGGLAFSPDGTLLASSGGDAIVRIWDAATWTTVRGLTSHSATVRNVRFSPDGTLLASASDDRTVRLWETSTGSQVRLLSDHTGPLRYVTFSPDGTLLATAAHDRTVRIWEASTGRPMHTLPEFEAGVNGVAFSPDGALLAAAIHGWDQTVLVLAVNTWSLEYTPDIQHKAYTVAFSPDGSILATAGFNPTVRLWDTHMHVPAAPKL